LKKLFWVLLAIFSIAASTLRMMNCITGFEAESALPIQGNLYGILLPALLLLAAVVFTLLSRSFPSQREEARSMEECFDFGNTESVLFAVLGSFGLIGYAATSVLSYPSLLSALLSVGYLSSAGVILCTVFQLRRQNELAGSLLIVPVCTLVLQLVFTYRSCANDPTLGHTYIEILMVCALMTVSLEFAAFAFRNGTLRLFVPLTAMSVVLCTCHLAECSTTSARLFAVGFTVLMVAFLSAVRFEKE